MDVGGARKFHVSGQSLTVIIPLVTLLVASGIWNIRQYKSIEQQRLRLTAFEREEAARAAAAAERAEAQVKKKAQRLVSDARMEQLYREINSLSQASERVLDQSVVRQSMPNNKDGGGTPTAASESAARPPF